MFPVTSNRFLGSTTLGEESGVSDTLGDGAVVARVGVCTCCSCQKKLDGLLIALLAGVPCSRNGVAGCGFCLSSQMRSSTAALSLSALEDVGMGNLVGREVTVSIGVVAPVGGMKMSHFLQ